MRHLLLAVLCLICFLASRSQTVTCGQKEMTERLFRQHPSVKQLNDQVESRLRNYRLLQKAGRQQQSLATPVTLPVVVHIIHNNGPENISDARVLTAIQHLNEAFANSGYYDPATGVNTDIQFCLAQRDTSGLATNGITRNASPYTVMSGGTYDDDLHVKDLNRWNPRCYINIWVVSSIPGTVAGYAYLPSAHGLNMDGIVVESGYFGTSNANDVVLIHEIGHYLGLYHTFEGACKNDDCSVDGDRVCDTPPDQSTAYTGCNTSTNSCNTDALSGFSNDVADMTQNYMDYGNWNCMTIFTQGQTDRMQWCIQNVRSSLLSCKSCSSPCPAPTVASFTASTNNTTAGSPVTFTNTSTNGSSYSWYVNNVLQSTAFQFTYQFPKAGSYTVKLVAHTSNPICIDASATTTVTVTCPVTAGFTPNDTSVATPSNINFIDNSTGAVTYQWWVNGVLESTSPAFSYNFTSKGNYQVKLVTGNGICSDSITRSIWANDVCIIHTFQQTYGGAGDDIGNDVLTTSDGGNLVAGKTTSFGSGGYDGYLVKIDEKGTLQWSRTYGGAQADELVKIIPAHNGGYIAVGQTRSYGFLKGAAWIIRVDDNGALLWSRQFGENSANGEAANNIIATSDGGYAITGSQNMAMGLENAMVIKIDGNGNLLWSKIFGRNDNDRVTAILEDNGAYIVTGHTRPGVFLHDVFIAKLDAGNGNIIWTNMYDYGLSNNLGGNRLIKQGNHYFTFSHRDDGFYGGSVIVGQPVYLVFDQNGVLLTASQYTPGGDSRFTTGDFVLTPDGGFVSMGNLDAAGSDFELYKTTSAGTIEWTKRFPAIGAQVNMSLSASPNGGIVCAGYSNASGNNDIYVVKTDGNGVAPNCPFFYPSLSIGAPPFTSAGLTWTITRTANFVAPLTVVPAVTDPATQSRMLCSGNTPCTVAPPDPCEETTFQRVFDSNNDIGREVTEAWGGGYLAAGSSDISPGQPFKALLLQTDSRGNVVKTKTFQSGINLSFKKIVRAANNEYFAITDGQLLRLNSTLDIIWAASILNYISGNFKLTALADAGNGEVLLAASDNGELLIIKVNTNGASGWYRRFAGTASCEINSLCVSGNFVYAAGNLRDLATPGGILYAGVMKLQLSDGTALWTRRINPGNRLTHLSGMHLKNAQLLLYMTGAQATGSSNHLPILIKLDTTGQVLAAQQFAAGNDYCLPEQGCTPTYDSGWVITYPVQGTDKWPYVIKTDSNLNIVWSMRYEQFTTHDLPNIIEDAAHNLVATGTVRTSASTTRQELLLLKIAASGSMLKDSSGRSCFYAPATVSGNAIPVQASGFNWTGSTYQSLIVSSFSYAAATGNFTDRAPCQGQSNCTSLKLQGIAGICNLNDTITISAVRNQHCYSTIEWSLDTTIAKIAAVTDTSIRITFIQPGAVKLYARMAPSCNLFLDSIDLYTFSTATTLNLGPDIQLCNVSTYPLHAGSNFKTYLWQDGSTDSTFTVYSPGKYHVETEDSCGRKYFDTIEVTQAPPVPFDLGPDLEKCKEDTLSITAPAGFINYSWSPGYCLTGNYTQSVNTFTDKDTAYIVVAEKAPGCLAMDTIRVKVHTLLPVDLGNDTSFCKPNSIILDAGSGFQSYLWNTGAAMQQIPAGSAGTYWVAATDPHNGCVARDTLVITDVYDIPVVDLGKDTAICHGSDRLLDAGGNYTGYLWQDGTSGPLYTVTQPGKYWVQVTDANHCKGSDSIEVVEKDCRKYIYFPNAFSPGNDHINNTFKPVVSGTMQEYYLVIYNRWGEKVFESSDAKKGWDGTHKGHQPSTGTYVYICRYRFTGANQQTNIDKGSVILVR